MAYYLKWRAARRPGRWIWIGNGSWRFPWRLVWRPWP